jgi:hypothetical protein
LSREKKLDEAITVFWDSSNNKIRDGHHACIMVDMAARCGNIAVSYFFLKNSWANDPKTRSSLNSMLLFQYHCSRFGSITSPHQGRRKIVGKGSKRRDFYQC